MLVSCDGGANFEEANSLFTQNILVFDDGASTEREHASDALQLTESWSARLTRSTPLGSADHSVLVFCIVTSTALVKKFASSSFRS